MKNPTGFGGAKVGKMAENKGLNVS